MLMTSHTRLKLVIIARKNLDLGFQLHIFSLQRGVHGQGGPSLDQIFNNHSPDFKVGSKLKINVALQNSMHLQACQHKHIHTHMIYFIIKRTSSNQTSLISTHRDRIDFSPHKSQLSSSEEMPNTSR
jgi:hypothetical protein